MSNTTKAIMMGTLAGIVIALLIWAATWGADPGPPAPTTTAPVTPITTTTEVATLVTAAPVENVGDCSKSDECCHHIHECVTGNPIACAWVNTHHCCPDLDCAEPPPEMCPTDPEGIPYCHDSGDCDSAETSCSWICCPDAPIAKLQGKKCCCPCVPDGNHSCAARQDQEEGCPCTIVTPQCCHGAQASSIGNLDVTTDGVTHKINCAWCALGIVTNQAEEAWCLAHCKDVE